MARKVAEAVAAKISSETGHDFQPVKGFQRMRSRGGIAVRPLDQLQRTALAGLKARRYIYNVSPIFAWKRRAGGQGFFVPKRHDGERVSHALVVLPASVRYVVKGEGVAEPVITLAEEMVKDILGAYDNPRKKGYDLREAGCFSTETPLEKLPAEEREEILAEAEEKHRLFCAKKVLQADELWPDAKMKLNVIEIHRRCLLFLQSLDPTSHEWDRDWAARRGQKKAATVECKFCGYEVKPGLAKCPNCKEVLDAKLYAKLQASA